MSEADAQPPAPGDGGRDQKGRRSARRSPMSRSHTLIIALAAAATGVGIYIHDISTTTVPPASITRPCDEFKAMALEMSKAIASNPTGSGQQVIATFDHRQPALHRAFLASNNAALIRDADQLHLIRSALVTMITSNDSRAAGHALTRMIDLETQIGNDCSAAANAE